MDAIDRGKIIEEVQEGGRELATLRVVICVLKACEVALMPHSGCLEVLKAVLSTETLTTDRIAAISARMDAISEAFQEAMKFILAEPASTKIQ